MRMVDKRLITRILSSDEFEEWNELVNLSNQGTVFHLSEWIKTSADASNTPFELIGVYDNNKLIGGCPIHYKKKYHLSYLTSNISLAPYGGVLLTPHLGSQIRENEQVDNAIINSLREYLEKKRFTYISIANEHNITDIRPYIWNGWNATIRYTYMQPLMGDIWNHISRKARNIIRKAQKLEVTIDKGYDPECYWGLNVDTYQKQNRPVPMSKEYITALMDMAIEKNLGEMWIAKMPNGDTAAAEFVLWDGKMAHRWSAASNSAYKESGATSLLLYELFVDMQKRGFTKMNMMAANTPQLTKFVSSFNPELQPYYIVTKSRIPFIRYLYHHM